MAEFSPRLSPLSIGSLPYTDPQQACRLMLEYCPETPAWPQLPKRASGEDVYLQFGGGFPGLVREDERICVDTSQELGPAVEQLYVAYLTHELEGIAMSPQDALGLRTLARELRDRSVRPQLVKGQITGPLSWAQMVRDQDGHSILQDPMLADAVAKHLHLKAAWQERELRKLSARTLILVDEPCLGSLGPNFADLGRERVRTMLEEVLAGIEGLRGMHCCGDMDWSLPLETPIDVLSLDAYDFGNSLLNHAEVVGRFLKRGGWIAWGIVPASTEVRRHSVASLQLRLEKLVHALAREVGIPFRELLCASFVAPACGLGGLDIASAVRAMHLTAELSAAMRAQHLE
jgi:methionine synthase II (cobalamin-independent)